MDEVFKKIDKNCDRLEEYLKQIYQRWIVLQKVTLD
jgi:hypothetical protein